MFSRHHSSSKLLTSYLMIALAAVAVVPAGPLEAQTRFWDTTLVGYMAMSFGLGYHFLYDSEFGSEVLGGGTGGGAITAVTVLGTVTGIVIGVAADARISRRNPPGFVHRNLVRLGTVGFGAGAGALIAAAWITFGEGNGPGDDERALAILSAAGAFGGAYLQYKIDGDLTGASWPNSVPVVAYRGSEGWQVGWRIPVR